MNNLVQKSFFFTTSYIMNLRYRPTWVRFFLLGPEFMTLTMMRPTSTSNDTWRRMGFVNCTVNGLWKNSQSIRTVCNVAHACFTRNSKSDPFWLSFWLPHHRNKAYQQLFRIFTLRYCAQGTLSSCTLVSSSL